MSVPNEPRGGRVGRTSATRLVLVGGGHAHVQLLDAWRRRPFEGVALTVVVDRTEAFYSGMVPGLVAGRYDRSELTLPVGALARSAGAALRVSSLASVDPAGRRLFLSDGTILPYHLASLNLGSTVAGWDVPGVAEHALTTRPLGRLLDALDEVDPADPRPVVVVGGGAAGVELAACLSARGGGRAPVTLLEAGPRILPGRSRRVARRTAGALAGRVSVRTGARVIRVEARAVHLDDGTVLENACTVWAVGAAPPPPLAASALPLDDAGFVRVRPTLQVVGHPDLFAVGDCASVEGHALPKAGVYAVRQGPVLGKNLERRVAGGRLLRYRPQSDFLTLLNLGDGRALATKWGLAVTGRWVMALKDRIDRRFVERFRV